MFNIFHGACQLQTYLKSFVVQDNVSYNAILIQITSLEFSQHIKYTFFLVETVWLKF